MVERVSTVGEGIFACIRQYSKSNAVKSAQCAGQICTVCDDILSISDVWWGKHGDKVTAGIARRGSIGGRGLEATLLHTQKSGCCNTWQGLC